MDKKASPATVIVAILVAVFVVGGLWYKFLGPGSQPPTPPETIPGATGQTSEAASALTPAGQPKSAPEGAGAMGATSGTPGATGR